jgi:hypothetical protein
MVADGGSQRTTGWNTKYQLRSSEAEECYRIASKSSPVATNSLA